MLYTTTFYLIFQQFTAIYFGLFLSYSLSYICLNCNCLHALSLCILLAIIMYTLLACYPTSCCLTRWTNILITLRIGYMQILCCTSSTSWLLKDPGFGEGLRFGHHSTTQSRVSFCLVFLFKHFFDDHRSRSRPIRINTISRVDRSDPNAVILRKCRHILFSLELPLRCSPSVNLIFPPSVFPCMVGQVCSTYCDSDVSASGGVFELFWTLST